MLRYIAGLGVKRALFVSILAALVVAGSLTAVAVNRVVMGAIDDAVVHHGRADARVLAADLAQVVEGGRAATVEQALAGAFDEVDYAYLAVLRPDGTPLASHFGASRGGSMAAVQAAQRAGGPDGHVVDGVHHFSSPISVTLVRPDGSRERREAGRLLLGLAPEALGSRMGEARLLVVTMLAGGGALLAVLVYVFTSRLVLRPLEEMTAVARRVSDSDLTARAEAHGEDELGLLARSLNRIGENLAATISRVQTVTGGVGEVIERIRSTGAVVSQGASTVSDRVVDTSSSMSDMIASLKGIADNVEVLAQSAEESSSSILEMAATNDEVAENIQGLAASVEETTAAIEQMTYSIKEVAKNIEDLSATTEQTSSSMNEMDVSISQVETNANETAKLSEQAQRDAEMGAEALSRTLGGIDKIKESSKEAASVIEALGRKISAIGNILNVIDDVAEQTNLLALNAAILAAQSGEHGKGFAVVADEIKDLAERTGASTKEISELIRAVQEQSRNAITAMDRGVRNVEEGVRLGQETETALKKIEASSHKATQMVKAIARATIEQARGSKQVTMAINRIAETVQQIATATAEQARGSEQIMKSAEKMKSITKHVERSSQEQARGSKQITKAIESISEMVHHLNRAQKEQTRGSEQVMGAVVQIKQVAEAQTRSARELEAAIGDLAAQADVLRGEVKRFRL